MVKENVLFFRTRQEKPLTFGGPEDGKKKTLKLRDRKQILLFILHA